MKILVLDYLIKQSEDRHQVSKDVLMRIFDEYRTLAELEQEGKAVIDAYLLSQNWKKFENAGIDNIRKYRLSAGDRILYTYGKYLPYIREADKDSMVLLAYAKHDEQGFFAKNKDFANRRHYEGVKELVEKIDELKVAGDPEFSVEDLIEINNILSADFIKGHTLSVVSDDVLRDIDTDELDKYLSTEQQKCLDAFGEKPQPTLILGGAGTGKTLVAIHLLNNFRLNNLDKKSVYLTQSNELLHRAETLYKVAGERNEIDKETHFYNVNDYCIDKLKKRRVHFFEAKQFEEFVASNKQALELCRKNAIDALDVWTEIRGTIKGTMNSVHGNDMGVKWSRFKPIPQDEFSCTKELVDKGYFKRDEYDKRKILLNMTISEINECLKKDETLTNSQKEEIEKALAYFTSFDSSVSMLDKEEYLGLPDEATTLPEDKRMAAWIICEAYEKFLRRNNYFDDNDLAREMISKAAELEKYDLIVVDEIQDYTELQIFLISLLSTTCDKVALAGDEHQNVNPTVFSEERVKNLFLEKGKDLQTVFLRKNFRCPRHVVDVANAIADIRKKMIGSKSLASEQQGEGERDGSQPYRLSYSEYNLKEIAREMSMHPGTAILVPDKSAKEELINIIGKEQYRANELEYIFSVPEIKGMEYEYVICYNLMGRHYETWNTIMTGKNTKHNAKYRFFFNLLYVGVTRSQNHLGFLDANLNDELEKKLKLITMEQFDFEELHFNELKSGQEDWIAMAQKYENNGNYKNALENYKKGSADVTNIYRCEMKIAEQERDYDVAARYAMLIGMNEKACNYAKEVEEVRDVTVMAQILAGRKTYNKEVKDEFGGLKELVEKCFMQYESNEIEMMKKLLLKAIGRDLQVLSNNITEMVGE